jgi:hypothetical protein
MKSSIEPGRVQSLAIGLYLDFGHPVDRAAAVTPEA